MDIRSYRPGPGMMVSAAFIGPGTVTACTLAGANFGFALVWALVFATVTTIILQSFAVKIALISNMGLAEAMMQTVSNVPLRWLMALLLLTALALGNAAYEAGNISGAVLGIEAIAGNELPAYRTPIILLLITVAAILILIGNPRWFTRILIALVLLMSLSFLLTFILTKPDIIALVKGLQPTIPEGSLMTAIALMGTTIVPYNLFLHAATVKQFWTKETDLPKAQTDNMVSIGIGGLVSITILATAAGALFGQNMDIKNATDMARQMNPLFGDFAGQTLGAGLFAAGLTSMITAPLATGYIVQEIVGRKSGSKDQRVFKATALLILLAGAVGASLNYSPIEIIFIAQIANGLLLPVIALFLLKLANDRKLLGKYSNGLRANLAGGFILLVTTLLGVRLILRAIGIWP